MKHWAIEGTTAVEPQPRPLIQPATACITGSTDATLSFDLLGWSEGLVTLGDWIGHGGPIDATDRLPSGGAWAHAWPGGCLLGASVQRPGALA